VDTEGDDVSRQVWYDGKTLTVFDRRNNTHASVAAPGGIEKMCDFVVEEYGLTPPLADLLFENLYDVLTKNVRSGSYLGDHKTGGQVCRHLAFRQDVVDWELWVDAGETPVPRKLTITYKTEPRLPEFAATMDDWNLSAEHPEERFRVKIPSGAREISMREMFPAREGE